MISRLYLFTQAKQPSSPSRTGHKINPNSYHRARDNTTSLSHAPRPLEKQSGPIVKFPTKKTMPPPWCSRRRLRHVPLAGSPAHYPCHRQRPVRPATGRSPFAPPSAVPRSTAAGRALFSSLVYLVLDRREPFPFP
jgi:hypothetical protein